jgi:hypothetical protein
MGKRSYRGRSAGSAISLGNGSRASILQDTKLAIGYFVEAELEKAVAAAFDKAAQNVHFTSAI